MGLINWLTQKCVISSSDETAVLAAYERCDLNRGWQDQSGVPGEPTPIARGTEFDQTDLRSSI